jgi:hypothetical protein
MQDERRGGNAVRVGEPEEGVQLAPRRAARGLSHEIAPFHQSVDGLDGQADQPVAVLAFV